MKMRKSFTMLQCMFAITAALGVLLTSAPAADTQNVIGEWRGFYQGIGDPDIKPATLTIGSQVNRRFDAIFEYIPCIMPVDGTIAASGQAIFSGKGCDGMTIGDVSLQDLGGGGAIFDGSVKMHPSDGTRQEGSLIVLRKFIGHPDLMPVDVTGDWRGFAISTVTGERRDVTASFEAERTATGAPTTGFAAKMGLLPCIFPAGLGTINSRGDALLIGQGDGERASLTGQVLNRATESGIIIDWKGSYTMKHSDGTEDRGTFEIQKVVSGR